MSTIFLLSLSLGKAGKHHLLFFSFPWVPYLCSSWWRPSLCSTSSTFQIIRTYQRGASTHVCYPGFISGNPDFAAATLEMSLYHWALEARGALHPWVPWDCSSRREFLAKYHSQGTPQKADQKTPSVFPRKRPICLSSILA